MLKALREHVAARSAAALREHAAFSSLANDVELDTLFAELGSQRGEHITRMRVPDDVLGLSLKEADFRSRYGAHVIAIETVSGKLLAPPDPQRSLKKEDILVVMQSSPAAADCADTGPTPKLS